MQEVPTRQHLWDNVSRLMQRRYGGENLTRLAKEAKIGPGSVTRLKEQNTSVGVNLLDKLAKVFRVQPWMLLVPGLDPDALPQLDDAAPAYSPEAVAAAELLELLPSPRDRDEVNAAIRTMVLDRMVSARQKIHAAQPSGLPTGKHVPGGK